MTEPIQFQTDLYRRNAVDSAAVEYRRRARIEVLEPGPHVIASLDLLARGKDDRALLNGFSDDLFSATARQTGSAPAESRSADDESDPL
jgi:hypothetical protein